MKQLTEATFSESVESSIGVVVVDFFKPDCAPCTVAEGVLTKLAQEFNERATFFQIDAVQAPTLTRRFEIQFVPAIVIFKHGRPVDFMMRAIRETGLRRKIEAQL